MRPAHRLAIASAAAGAASIPVGSQAGFLLALAAIVLALVAISLAGGTH